jgi:ketosteroid isomerase-like protein
MRNPLEGGKRRIGMKTVILAIFVVLPLLVGTQIQSQMVVPNLSPSNLSLSPLISTEQEVRQFFDKYVERYTKMDIEEFLLLFSLKARQNQRDTLPEIRTIYTTLFNRSQSLQLSVEEMRMEIYQNAVEIKAQFTVKQVLKEGGEKKVWRGDARWILAKEDDKLQILSIDYQYSIPPTPAGEKVPELPPPLAEEEEVKEFFSSYIDRYNRKEIDGFLSLFSSKAVQNKKDGLEGIKTIYTKFFNESQELRYHMEEIKIEIYQNSVEVKARFKLDQTLKKRGQEKAWRGDIRWVLAKEEGALKILSLDYQNEKSP